MIRQFIYSLFLTLVWCLFTESFNANTLIIGFGISLLIVYFLRRAHVEEHYLHRLAFIIRFILIFFKEVIIANLAVLKIVYHPKMMEKIQPGILEYPLDVNTGFSITLLANAITLTPGTLSVEISPDRKNLYIHCLRIEDLEKTKKYIKKNLEMPILKIWGSEENGQ